jgi:hypothetical protein
MSPAAAQVTLAATIVALIRVRINIDASQSGFIGLADGRRPTAPSRGAQV